MIEDWLQLQKVSLFGTAKESLDKLSFSDTLSGFRENVKRKAKNPEEEFFFLCALSLNYINAGKEFPKMSEIPYKEAEPETKAIISAEKTSILQKILSHDFADVLQFFLSACVNTKEIIPPEFVPRLLDYGKKFIELRKYLPDSTGKRGEWLVSLNPDWDYLSPKTEKEAWEEGKTAERVELLKNVRERDAALSREYLLSTWKEENAANRTAFLLCMRQGLSPDDEKMLESFLSDKSDRVRSIAVDFLVRIKDSKLRSKLSAYIPSCIKFKGSGKLLSSASLEFIIPTKTGEMFSDLGIKLDKDIKGLTPEEGEVFNFLSLLPPSELSSNLGTNPEEFIRLLQSSKKNARFLPAIYDSTSLHSDRDWAKAILEEKSKNSKFPAMQEDVVIRLLDSLQDTDLEYFLDKKIYVTGRYGINILYYLNNCRFPWSYNFTQKAMNELGSQYKNWYYNKNEIYTLNPYIHPDFLEKANEIVANNDSLKEAISNMLLAVELRKRIKESFNIS